MINKCIRCGDELVDFAGIDGIVYPSPGKGVKHCVDCGIIFSDIGGNRIKISIEWPKNKCRKCYHDCVNGYCSGCTETGVYMDEFPTKIIITHGLAEMILESKRSWDESWYGCHPLPDKRVGMHVVGFVMAVMFGFNKNFKIFGLSDDENTINIKSVKYGEVWAMNSRGEVV